MKWLPGAQDGNNDAKLWKCTHKTLSAYQLKIPTQLEAGNIYALVSPIFRCCCAEACISFAFFRSRDIAKTKKLVVIQSMKGIFVELLIEQFFGKSNHNNHLVHNLVLSIRTGFHISFRNIICVSLSKWKYFLLFIFCEKKNGSSIENQLHATRKLKIRVGLVERTVRVVSHGISSSTSVEKSTSSIKLILLLLVSKRETNRTHKKIDLTSVLKKYGGCLLSIIIERRWQSNINGYGL